MALAVVQAVAVARKAVQVVARKAVQEPVLARGQAHEQEGRGARLAPALVLVEACLLALEPPLVSPLVLVRLLGLAEEAADVVALLGL